MICKKCVLPESKPDIWLNEEGVCNICLEFERKKSLKNDAPLSEFALVKLLNSHRGRNKYDCLVMCSGGKDSTLSLYYMKKKYRMNVLAFTFDHGFENEEALTNIRNAVSLLGVDWLYFRSDFMKEVFSRILKCGSDAPLCHVCAIWYMQLTFDIAARHKIPMVVAGWTKGQSTEMGESGREYASMSKATEEFIIRHLHTDKKYKDFPRSMKEVVRAAQRKSKITIISPHWFLPYEPESAMEILRKDLNWRLPALSYPKNSTNCMMNFVYVHRSMKRYGYTHYHIEMSKLIRKGELSREEALELLEVTFGEDVINSILAKVGC